MVPVELLKKSSKKNHRKIIYKQCCSMGRLKRGSPGTAIRYHQPSRSRWGVAVRLRALTLRVLWSSGVIPPYLPNAHP